MELGVKVGQKVFMESAGMFAFVVRLLCAREIVLVLDPAKSA